MGILPLSSVETRPDPMQCTDSYTNIIWNFSDSKENSSVKLV